MSIGERIIELRKEKNISQGQLAKALDVSRQAVSKWENDSSVPDALKMIYLADFLDSDIEYLATGRRNFARRPPVVLTETKIVEKVVEKPVIQEKIVEKYIEVPVVEIVEKTVTKPVYRTKYIRNPLELLIIGGLCFILGLFIGSLI
jgi:transcriptional regulator with XRE-family HTH domain